MLRIRHAGGARLLKRLSRGAGHVPAAEWSLSQLKLEPDTSSAPSLDSAAFDRLVMLAHLANAPGGSGHDSAAVLRDLDGVIRCAQTIKALDLSHLSEPEIYRMTEAMEAAEDDLLLDPSVDVDVVVEGEDSGALLRQAPMRQGNFFQVPLAK